MLWNRWEDAVATGDVRGAILRRFHLLVDGAGLDEDRARAWTILRLVVFALEQWDEQRAADGASAARVRADTSRLITTAVTVAKAVQAG